MLDTTTLISYLIACVAIILAPGPAQALVLARTVSDGKKSGMMTAVGLNLGTLFHTFAAALGISAVLATSAAAFALVKYAGAAYLIYLGVQAFRAKTPLENAQTQPAGSSRQVLLRALVTGILNPKVAIFFLAFLPQFVDPARGSVLVQFVILGSILAALDVVYEIILVYVVYALSHRMTANPGFARLRQRVTGTVLIGLGVRLAFAQRE